MARDDAPERWRLFVAVDLSEEARGIVAEAQTICRRQRLPLRWVVPEHAHLTVRFLGDVERERVDELGTALTQAAARHQPFLLHTDAAGVFPNARRPRVLWLGVAGPTECLDDLQQDVEMALHGLGFPLETHVFHPHLTLGRVRDGVVGELPGLADALADIKMLSTAAVPVQEVRLMRSELGPDGSRYSTLTVAPLGQADT